MGVTINVNDLTMCHKGSGGVVVATVPDVCRTPSPGGPAPVPYPNVARSKDLAHGSKSVTADGGQSIAVKRSEFRTSRGDEPGTLGGVTSGTVGKEATWLSYSTDVKVEGQSICRLTDKMLMNHGNTVCLGGLLQQWLEMIETASDLVALCEILCHCEQNPTISKTGRSGYQQCMEDTLTALDIASGGNSKMKPEVPYNMLQTPPVPISKNWMYHDHLKPKRPGMTTYQRGDVRVPDVVLVKDPQAPATQSNLRAVIEVKFKNDPWDSDEMQTRQKDYRDIAGPDAQYIELDAQRCGCKDGKRQPIDVDVPAPEFDWKDVALLVAAGLLCLTPIPGDEYVVGAGAAARGVQWLRYAF